ncbi:MAG: TldD/PmbA family protein [Nocardioidaceae bacterium]|nr:TldD/PmbA family protein [Nocardioidaceae bacterium]
MVHEVHSRVSPPLLRTGDCALVLAEALRCGGDWAEIFAERRDSQTVRLDGGSVAEIRSDRDAGAGVRIVADGRTGFAYTNVLTRSALLEAAQAAAATMTSNSPRKDPTRVDLRVRAAPVVQRSADPGASAETGDTVELLRRIDFAARESGGEIHNVAVTCVAVSQEVMVATTDGLVSTDNRVRTRVTCRVTARREGRLETGFCGPGAGTGMELYADWPPETVGTEAAKRALRALEGADPPRGVLPVVLGSSGGGLLLHEACAHGLEGDGLTRNSSVFAKTRGEQVGSRLVNAYDDPSLDLGYGSYGADDEGAVSTPTTLMEDGTQLGALTDRATASLLGQTSSGNGRRESYAHPALPRMSNTFIAAGTDKSDAIIGDVRRGVYVAALKGGDVDITNGEFAFAASEAYLIEHGRVTQPLAGLTLLGNGPAALASIAAVGDDLSFTQALCGKEGQWVPVSYGSPTLLVTGLTVSGRQS